MLVILNIDASVNCVFEDPKDIDQLYFNPEEGMTIIEMPKINDDYSLDVYVDYFVLNGIWVHFNDIDENTLGLGKPAKQKGEC